MKKLLLVLLLNVAVAASASGDHPIYIITDGGSWSLTISQQHLHFVAEHRNMRRPYQKLADSSGFVRYRSVGKKEQIQVVVRHVSCRNDSTATREVEGTIRVLPIRRKEPRVTLNGCGVFIPDQRLGGVWQLKWLEGRSVVPGDFANELPYVDIIPEKELASGFAGCNRFTGNLIFAADGRLTFDKLTATKMICLEGNRESHFMRALSGSNRFAISNNQLILYENDIPRVVLLRMD